MKRWVYRGVGIVQWWECLPSTTVAWVQLMDLALRAFLWVLWYSSFLKNQHCKCQFDLETMDKKSYLVERSPLNPIIILIPLYILTFYTLTSIKVFSILFSIHSFKVLTRRICLTINNFFGCSQFPLFSWPYCMIQGWYCKEKLDASHS